MPRSANSGTKNLYKNHRRGCPSKGTPARPTLCGCPWYGWYKGRSQSLAKWAKHEIDPKTKRAAELVLTRWKAAIDAGTYRPEGEQEAIGTGDTFKAFVAAWQRDYAEPQQLSQNSLEDMLNVLVEMFGGWTLKSLAGDPLGIEKKLNATAVAREWTDNTWNGYHELLTRLMRKARKWKLIAANPMEAIERRTGESSAFRHVRIEEDVEAKLFAACEKLNRPQHRPHSQRLDWDKVNAIRVAVEGGESQKAVAERFGISTGLCCQIIKRDIWAPERYRQGTKGDEMRLRLLAAFRCGLRRGEMQATQLKQVSKRPMVIEIDVPVGEGGLFRKEQREVLTITYPPRLTKGGKSTGEPEVVYVGDDALKDALIKRRFELRNDPEAYVFGTKDGRQVKDFKRMWHELFDLAVLDWGRDKGLVWHRIRHEFVSRVAEETDDVKIVMDMARHRDLETSQGYMHSRPKRLAAAAVRLGKRP